MSEIEIRTTNTHLLKRMKEYFDFALTPQLWRPEVYKCLFLTWNSLDRRDHEIVSGVTGGRALLFSRLGYGGNRSPEPVEGNAEGAKLPRKQVAEKTSP